MKRWARTICFLGVPCAVLLACPGGYPPGIMSAGKTGELGTPALRGSPTEEMLGACGPGSTTSKGAQQIARRPYLQQLGPDEGWLVWTAKRVSSDVVVEITLPDGALVQRAVARVDETADPWGAKQLNAKFSGLSPSTVYCWSITSEGEQLVGPTGFRTAPARGSGEVSFLAFGDGGTGGSDQAAVLAQMYTVPFDLIVMLGDVAYDDGRLFEFENNVFDVYADLFRSFPVFPTSGNHEYRTDEAEPYLDVFKLPENGGHAGRERWYSFDWGPIHFVSLDTERVGAEQAEWLAADLSSTTQPWRIVFLHRPPFSSGEHGSSYEVQKWFVPELERHRVHLVLSGHDHNYERTIPINGVQYLVSGGAGRSTDPVGSSWFTAFSESVLHFLSVHVRSHELSVHAIDATGQEFDSVVVSRE